MQNKKFTTTKLAGALFALLSFSSLNVSAYDSTSLVDTNNNSNSTSTVNSTNTNNNNNINTNNTTVDSNSTNVNTNTNTNYSYGNVTNNNNNVNTSTSTNTNTNTSTNTNYNYGEITTNSNNNSNSNVSSDNKNTNINESTSKNENINKTDQNVNSVNTNNNNSNINQKIESPPPTAIAPSMMSGGNLDLCTTGVSAAVQSQMLGISGGGTIRDLNCERLKLSKYLYDMGMKVAAVATLCQDHRVYEAMLNAGTPCPINGQIGEQAKIQWAENKDKIPVNEKPEFQLRLLYRIYHILF